MQGIGEATEGFYRVFPGFFRGKISEKSDRLPVDCYSPDMRKTLPNIADIERKSLENHFSLPPGDALFQDPKKVFIVTAIEAGAGWTLTYDCISGKSATRSGSGNREFHHPVTAAHFTDTTGVDRIVGFYLG